VAKPVAYPYWSADELVARATTERQLFVTRYQQQMRAGYAAVETACTAEVIALFEATDCLRSFGEDPALFATHPALLVPARFITSPPISNDTLKIVAIAQGSVDTILGFLDRERFPWLDSGGAVKLTSPAVKSAITMTAKLMAQQRAATASRTASSQAQEEKVRDVLMAAGLSYVKREDLRKRMRALGDTTDGLTGTNYQEVLKRGEFTREFPLAGTKCDVPVRLDNGDLLPIECKVSNSEVNSVKRLNRETGGKHDRWRNTFGSTLHTGAVLSGVFKLLNLQQAQDGGVVIFFEFELKDTLTAFVQAGGKPRAKR